MNLDEINIKRYNLFFSQYDLENAININALDRKIYLGNKSDKCRFCGCGRESTTFKNLAHVIPKLLGNRYLVSYFECDECNKVFKVYEDSLANYLGPYRTISSTKRGSSVPKFKQESERSLTIFQDENGVIQFISPEFKHLDLNVETKEGKIRSTKPPYVPIHVFKILTKIACCLLPESELNDFSETMRFLLNDFDSAQFDGLNMFNIQVYFIPGPVLFPDPISLLFKRKETETKIPSRVAVLHYKNFVIQSLLPFSKQDELIYGNKQEISIPVYPLRIPKEWFEEFGSYSLKFYDLTSSKKVYNEEFLMEMKFINLQKMQ